MYPTTYKKSLPVFTCDVHEEFKLKNVLLLKMCYIGTSAHANSPVVSDSVQPHGL